MNIRRLSLTLLANAVLLLWAAPAWSQIRIVLPTIADDDGGQIRERIADHFADPDQYQFVDYQWIAEELSLAGLTLDHFLSDPQLLSELASTAGFDVLLYGSLDRPRRARQLQITAHEGASGEQLGTVSIELDRGRIEEESFEWGMAEVDGLIAQATPVREPEPEPVEPEPVVEEPQAPVVMAPAEPTGPRIISRWLQLGVGIDAVRRSLSLVGDEGGIDYSSGFYTGFEGTVEVFPVRLFSPSSVLAGLGLKFRVARYFTDTLLVRPDESSDLSIPTRHKELGLLLVYLYRLGPVDLQGHVGYQGQDFVLGANDVYESSRYRGIGIGVGGRYHILEELLSAALEVEVRPGPRLGDPELIAFGGGTAFGFGLKADVTVRFLRRFQAVGAYSFRQFNTSFDGGGSSSLTGPIDSTDTYHLLGLNLHWAY